MLMIAIKLFSVKLSLEEAFEESEYNQNLVGKNLQRVKMFRRNDLRGE